VRFHIFSILFVFTITGCAKDSGFTPSPVDSFVLPLVEGNFWVYERIGIDSSGATIDSSVFMMAVGQPDTIGNDIAFPVSNFRFEFEGTDVFLRVNRSDGLYNVKEPIPDPPVFIHILTFPTAVGDSLPFRGYVIRTGLVNESVRVPVGTFTCVRYDISLDGIIVGQTFVAPNVGIVRFWQRYFGLLREENRLRSYYLN